MTTTTSYGTWVNHGDKSNVTVEATIADSLSGGDAEWREVMETSGAADAIAAAYRNAINDALDGTGIALCGNEFIGDIDAEDTDIAEIISTIDLGEIVESHDVPSLIQTVKTATRAAKTAADNAEGASRARAMAVTALVRACGNQTTAAELLGVSPGRVSRLVAKAENSTAV